MNRNRARNIYVNGVPTWECGVCGARFASSEMEMADAHVKRCRALHRA